MALNFNHLTGTAPTGLPCFPSMGRGVHVGRPSHTVWEHSLPVGEIPTKSKRTHPLQRSVSAAVLPVLTVMT